MTGFVLKRFVKLLKTKGFRVVKQNRSFDAGIWIVRGFGLYGIIAPDMKEWYAADFFMENEEYWNKCSRCPISVDVSKVNMELLFADMEFLASEEGKLYNGSYAYLDDDKAKFKTMCNKENL